MLKHFACTVAVLAFGAAGYSLWEAHRTEVGMEEVLMGSRIDVSRPGETRTSFNQRSIARYDDVLHNNICLHFEPPVWGHLDLAGRIIIKDEDGVVLTELPFSDPFAGMEGMPKFPYEKVFIADLYAIPRGEYDVVITMEKGDPSLRDHAVRVKAHHVFNGYYSMHIFLARGVALGLGVVGLLFIIPVLISFSRKKKDGSSRVIF